MGRERQKECLRKKGKDSTLEEGMRKKCDEKTEAAAISNSPRLRLTLVLKAKSDPLKLSTLVFVTNSQKIV